jgi:putative oxidoreductase
VSTDQTRPFDIGTLGGAEPPVAASRRDKSDRRPVAWNGGADVGLLILRFAVGGLFFAHGAQKVFGLWGGQGIARTTENLAAHGFAGLASSLAWALGVVELVAGAFVVLGLLTPLAAAGLLAVKLVAVAVKWGTVPLYAALSPDALEVDVLLGAGAATLLFTGAGRIALDNGRTWQRRPLPYAWLCLIISLAVAAVVYFVLRK